MFSKVSRWAKLSVAALIPVIGGVALIPVNTEGTSPDGRFTVMTSNPTEFGRVAALFSFGQIRPISYYRAELTDHRTGRLVVLLDSPQSPDIVEDWVSARSILWDGTSRVVTIEYRASHGYDKVYRYRLSRSGTP